MRKSKQKRWSVYAVSNQGRTSRIAERLSKAEAKSVRRGLDYYDNVVGSYIRYEGGL